MNSSAPAITVVMPVHNAEHYVRQAVRSLLTQTFTDFEALIIDDASTDQTAGAIREVVGRDDRFAILSQPKKSGIVAALNLGVAKARGEFIARMDGDDACVPRRFDEQLDYLRSHPDCVAVGSWTLHIDPWGNELGENRLPAGHEEIESAMLQGHGGMIAHPAAMIRRQAMLDIGAYRADFEVAQDVDLFLRLAEVGELANIPRVLLLYRQHAQSASLTRRSRQLELMRRIVNEARARRGMNAIEPAPAATVEHILAGDDYRRSWALHAIHRHNRPAALRHALTLVRDHPAHGENWRILRWAIAA